MTSIFTRIYSYRQRENSNPKEDYLTEIFTFCLENDPVFLSVFFDFLEIQNAPLEECTIKTQVSYEGFGRPDLEIICGNIHILIESKVEYTERDNQLTDYKSILKNSKFKEKHLVYLTKYYNEYSSKQKKIIAYKDEQTKQKKKITFHPIRWFQIYETIQESCDPFTQQLKNYLKEEDMADSKNFDNYDLVALQRIHKTVSKMDEVLDTAKTYFENKLSLGSVSKRSARSTAMTDMAHYRDFKNVRSTDGYDYKLDMGFSLLWEDDIFIYFNFWLPKSNTHNHAEEYKKLLESEFEDMEIWDEGTGYTAFFCERVSSFFNEDSNIQAMIDYLKECIDKVAEFINKYPDKFGLES